MADDFGTWWQNLFNTPGVYLQTEGTTQGTPQDRRAFFESYYGLKYDANGQVVKRIDTAGGIADSYGNLVGADGRPYNPFGLTPKTPKGYYDGKTFFDHLDEEYDLWKGIPSKAVDPVAAELKKVAFTPDAADIALRANRVRASSSLHDSFGGDLYARATALPGGPRAQGMSSRRILESPEEISVKNAILKGFK